MRALVLSGGGSKGAYEASALKYLLGDLNLKYDILCGVSVGALNVAFLSMFDNDHNQEALNSLLDIWLNIKTSDVYKRWCPFGRLSALWKNSLYDSSPLQKMVRSKLNLNQIRSTGKKVAVGAVSLTSGNYKTFTQDDDNFIDGVLASAAFPAFLTPIQIGDELYTDGGVKEITPLQTAIDLGATVIDVIMCSPMKTTKAFSNTSTTPTLAMRIIDLMSDEIVYDDIETALLYNELIKAGVKCEKKPVTISMISPDQDLTDNSLNFNQGIIREMMDKGYQDAKNKFKPIDGLL